MLFLGEASESAASTIHHGGLIFGASSSGMCPSYSRVPPSGSGVYGALSGRNPVVGSTIPFIFSVGPRRADNRPT